MALEKGESATDICRNGISVEHITENCHEALPLEIRKATS